MMAMAAHHLASAAYREDHNMKKLIIQKERNHRVTKDVAGGISSKRTITLRKVSPQIEAIQIRQTFKYDEDVLN